MTIEVVDTHEQLLGSGRFGTTKAGYAAMQRYVKQWPDRLLRQYLPRRLDFSCLPQDDFDAIADQLNGRPRQTLGFKTPSSNWPRYCVDRLSLQA